MSLWPVFRFGAVSIARGLDDTPTLVALGLAVIALDLPGSVALLAKFMAVGAPERDTDDSFRSIACLADRRAVVGDQLLFS